MRSSAKSKRRAGRVRIVAGKWRHRFISVVQPAGNRDAVRPTPDRVRETVFNWLQPVLPGARVLDLYAGTGILGLEALSRGAAHATFVERDRALARRIAESLETLGASEQASVVCDDVPHYLGARPAPVSIAFLDPPYSDTAHAELCERLAANGWLRAGARIYLEQDSGDAVPELPPQFEIQKNKTAGHVRYMLARFS